tara:strand:+ start:36 stop:776 length:741 start_codon:yes stop_codon:yes gene_type:complete
MIISKDSILVQVDKKAFWIPGIDIKFLGDFFFSRFFSSKIMGYIYLSIFILILFIQRDNMFKIRNYNFYFLILILISYTVPFFYGLIKIPVLTDRYIIFIVIPIILIITSGIMNIKNLNLKVFLIAIIFISTISDYTLRIKKNEVTKPEFKKAIKFINNSTSKNILINNKNINNEQDFKVIKNYLMSLNNTLVIKNSIEENENNIWKLCYLPASDFECAINDNSIKFLQTETKSFKLVTINLYNIK